MALRAFRCNPALGGFGNETGLSYLLNEAGEKATEGKSQQKQNPLVVRDGGSGDAFAQILKELVDNAVDACGHCLDSADNTNAVKRVRVSIESVGTSASDKADNTARTENDNSDRELLRVEVNDNGCGMDDIEKYVSAFNSSKGHNDLEGIDSHRIETAGRYGIGLTLCLLHAQRLVPNSCAVITSTVRGSSSITRAKFVVDMARDSVICVEKSNTEKENTESSGTSITLLLPGGIGASKAWPRLAEYFARFQLSLGLACSLEVMAPSLSRLPLFIRPPKEEKKKDQTGEIAPAAKIVSPNGAIQQPHENDEAKKGMSNEQAKDGEDFYDFLDNDQCTHESRDINDHITASTDENSCIQNSNASVLDTDQNGCNLELEDVFVSPTKRSNTGHEPVVQRVDKSNKQEQEDKSMKRRMQMRNSVSAYLKKPIDLDNVAHSNQKIRRSGAAAAKIVKSAPTLDVDIIVSEFDDDEDSIASDQGDNDDFRNHGTQKSCPETDRSKAKIMLIRMVNRVPMLDSAEASACGLVRGLQHKSLWNSYGLEIAAVQALPGRDQEHASISEALHVPTFSLGDTAHVAPFFTKNTVHELLSDDESSDVDGDDDSLSGSEERVAATRKRRRRSKMALKPAGLRLGNVLIIIQLNAKSSELPLPTLSKGRLPMNDDAINAALQSGLNSCLRSLQKTNPSLLLTPSQLKKTEREVIYVPTLASALSSLTLNCNDETLREKFLANIGFTDDGSENPSKQTQDNLAEHLECRIRHSLLKYEEERKQDAKKKQRATRQTKTVKHSESIEIDDIDDNDSISMTDSQYDLEKFIRNHKSLGLDETYDSEESLSDEGGNLFEIKNGTLDSDNDDLTSTFSSHSPVSKETSNALDDRNSFIGNSNDDDFDDDPVWIG